MHSEQNVVNAPDSRGKWWVLAAIGVGTFMSALDGSVVNIILPVVRAGFQSDVSTVEWVVAIYLLVVSGLLLSFGRLGDLRGHKSVYLSGFGIFIAGSALCGLASSARMLVAFRVFQALGAAMLLSNSPAILTRNFPPRQRGQALGLQGMMTYLGLTVGPSLGGWLTQQFSWRAVFYINVPVGLLAMALSLIFIPADGQNQQAERFDLAGAFIFMTGLVALLLGLNQGAEWGWTSAPILGLLAASLALFVGFVFLELRLPAPMLDLSLFKQRVFSAAAASAILNYISLYTVLFLMPFYLIQGRGLNPAQAGLLLTAQPLVMVVVTPLSGALSDRMGSRLLATLGMAIMAGGLLGLAQLGPSSPLNLVALYLGVVGLGTGLFISPNTSALLGAAPRNRQGVASGILATARNVGMMLGIGMAGAILTTRMLPALPASLFDAVRIGFLAAAGAALLSGLTSATRGEESRNAPPAL